MLTHHADDGGKKAWSPGRARINRKAIAQGRPDCFRFTCMLMCSIFFDAQQHMRPRVQRAPGLPCALFIGGSKRNGKPRTKPCRENEKVCFALATRQPSS